MSDDRDKLLKIMSSLEKDYRSGKISAENAQYTGELGGTMLYRTL